MPSSVDSWEESAGNSSATPSSAMKKIEDGNEPAEHPISEAVENGPSTQEAIPDIYSASKSLLFDKLDWWISDEDIFTGLQSVGISIHDLDFSEFGFLEHNMNGKSKGSCFMLFKSTENCHRAFQYFQKNPLCEECIIKKGHPSVSFNPYRTILQKQRVSSAIASAYHDSSSNNRPGIPMRHDSKRQAATSIREKRSNSIDRRSVQSNRRSRSRSRSREKRRRSRSRSRTRRVSRSPPRPKRDKRKNRSRSRNRSKDRSGDLSRDRPRDRSRDRVRERSRSRDRGRNDRDKVNRNDSNWQEKSSQESKRKRSRTPPSKQSSAKVDLRERIKKKNDA